MNVGIFDRCFAAKTLHLGRDTAETSVDLRRSVHSLLVVGFTSYHLSKGLGKLTLPRKWLPLTASEVRFVQSVSTRFSNL